MHVGNAPQEISAGADGILMLTAESAELYGPSIVYDQEMSQIADWKSPDDYAEWKVNVPLWRFWNVEFDYACDDSAAGNLLRLATHTRMMSARVPGTGPAETRRRWMAGSVELFPRPVTLRMSAPEGIQFSLMNLRAIRLIPPDEEKYDKST